MAQRPEPYQRTPADQWLFATVALRLSGSELTAVLALHPHMDDETLEAFPGLPRMATRAGCEVRKITRGLAGLIHRGVLTKSVGGGRGNLTVYQGIIAAQKTGAEHPHDSRLGNPSPAGHKTEEPLAARDPVSATGSLKESCAETVETGSETGSQTGSAPRVRASRKGKVEQSTPRFPRSGPTGDAVGPGAEEKLKDFAWRIAKAFPAKRGGVPQASAALKTFIAEGHASREEIEAGLRAWAPYFEACFRENGHHTGTTLAGWLEAQHFRFDPRDVHDWTPEDDESSELFS